jgi:hypothetical protein
LLIGLEIKYFNFIGKSRKIPYVVVCLKSKKYRYIEKIEVFEIVKIITDIKLIHATYLIFSVAAKSESRKIWPPTIKKGKSVFQIHPFE